MSVETERVLEVATLIGQRLHGAVSDVIPAEAQAHLLNAQRELLTALFLIYEHQVAARRPVPAPRRPVRGARRQQPRIQRIEVE